MSNLFIILLLISFAGLIKPSWFSRITKQTLKRRYYVISIVVCFILIGATAPDEENSFTASAPESSVTAKLTATPAATVDPEKAKADADAKAKEEADAKAKVKEEPKKEDTKAEDNVPKEYKSALKKAETYAKTMNMSKSAINDQLTSEYGEKFSQEAAKYAIDNLQFDWKANALKKAESYSKTMHMSKQGTYDQLVSEQGEKFTKDEAQYAVDNMKADFKGNALKKAKDYQDSMSMSPEAIRVQLTSEHGEKFTKEEADYAIKNSDK